MKNLLWTRKKAFFLQKVALPFLKGFSEFSLFRVLDSPTEKSFFWKYGVKMKAHFFAFATKQARKGLFYNFINALSIFTFLYFWLKYVSTNQIAKLENREKKMILKERFFGCIDQSKVVYLNILKWPIRYSKCKCQIIQDSTFLPQKERIILESRNSRIFHKFRFLKSFYFWISDRYVRTLILFK